jgi:hypothetical protein
MFAFRLVRWVIRNYAAKTASENSHISIGACGSREAK